MPWEIPIYICSRFAEALEQIYIPVGLFKNTPPLKQKGTYLQYCANTDKNFDFPNKNVGVIHEYGLSLLNPPAPLKWKIENFFE